jgi:N-ethylmaleimide reductase
LFETYKLGPITLANRLVMAPLTRNRAAPGTFVPSPLAADYYGQRASAGLLITEASQVSQQGQGYQDTPGIYSKDQVAGWRKVTDKVHQRGGKIFIQLWHVGRISHVDLQANGAAPVAPSAIRAKGKTFVNGTFADVSEPRALELSEIPGIIDDFKRATKNALEAGFDGVEIHGANGYLLEQFLQSRSNQRTDQYGGSIENRARLLMEVTQAAIDVWGANRVGVRLSPHGIANDSAEPDPMPLYTYVVKALDKLGLAYLHVIEPRSSGAGRADVHWENVPSAMVLFRPHYSGVLMTAGGFTGETANAAIADGHADIIAFGRIFISNPDLPRRLEHDYPITPYNRATFYGGEEKGYTDYPVYDELTPA